MVAPSVPEDISQGESSARSASSNLGDGKPPQRRRRRTLKTEVIAKIHSPAASEAVAKQSKLGNKEKPKRKKKRTLNADKPDPDHSASVQGESRDREALSEPTRKRKPKSLGDKQSSKSEDNRTLNLNNLIQAAYQLPRSDVQALADALQGMLEAWEATNEFRGQDKAELLEIHTLKQSKSKSMRGHFELKMINGCGPYAYLRWWSGGKHRSSYLGKARPKA